MVNSRSDGWHDVVVLMPEQFNDALEAVLAVREQRTVVLNLSRLTPELAQRATDLVSGGVPACLLYTSPSQRDATLARLEGWG